MNKGPGAIRFDPLEPSPALARELAGRLTVLDPWKRLGYRQENLERFYLRPSHGAEHFLLCRDGALLGLLCLQYPWLKGVYIEQLAVFPECQGQGVGRQALAYVERRFGARTRNLWLLVSGFNREAQGFYRHCGFREIGVIPDLVVAGEDEILMRKLIA